MNTPFRIDGRILETERLVLRPFKDEDIDDFYAYASIPGVGERAGWHHHGNRDESRRVLTFFMNDDKDWAVFLRENGRVIGSLGVDEYDTALLPELSPYRGRAIGYVLGKDYWGRGLATEAVKAVTQYLFNESGLDFLTLTYYDFNTQSKRVSEKCGFRPYRKVTVSTQMGTRENGVLNLLLNPSGKLDIAFPEKVL
jgi:[ribosomal protein S5]-alanine N-acetyltransferase